MKKFHWCRQVKPARESPEKDGVGSLLNLFQLITHSVHSSVERVASCGPFAVFFGPKLGIFHHPTWKKSKVGERGSSWKVHYFGTMAFELKLWLQFQQMTPPAKFNIVRYPKWRHIWSRRYVFQTVIFGIYVKFWGVQNCSQSRSCINIFHLEAFAQKSLSLPEATTTKQVNHAESSTTRRVSNSSMVAW